MDNQMDNQMDKKLTPRLGPLDEMSLIDRQNLVISYVILVYNMLYNLGESFAGHLIGMVNRPNNLRKIVRNGRYLPTSSNDMGYIFYHSYGPTEWDSVLFDESMTIRLKLDYTPTSCSVAHTMKTESTAINDDLNDAEHEQIEERRRIQAPERPRITLEEDDSSSVDSDEEPYNELPTKRYCVITESENKFERTSKGVSAESRVTFGFKIDSSPESQPGDTECHLTILTESFITIDCDRIILTSTTRVDELFINDQGQEKKTEHVITPTICLAQTMNEHDAHLLADVIVVNYTSIINIISIALILYFGSS